MVLAAGAATRFGSPKQRLLLGPVLDRVRRARSVGHVLVVLGAHPVETDAQVVHCPEWARGPGASLRCGLRALPRSAEAAVVVLADGPQLAAEAVDRIVDAWRSGAGDVVAASYGGVRGHPVLLARAVWDAVPDEGARALEPVLVACDDLGAPGDVDRREDLVATDAPAREWSPELTVDEPLARRLVRGRFPGVPLESLLLLGSGWDNTVWLADGRWVFRFPRREIAVAAVERQVALLPALARSLPLPIPEPLLVGRPGEEFPWPFFGAPFLPGREPAAVRLDDAARARLGAPLGAFLRELHDPRLVRETSGAAELPVDPMGRADMRRRVPRTRERLAELERLGLWRAPRRVHALLDEADALPDPAGAPVVAHGDLHLRHLLVDDGGNAAAVIDWDDLCLGDPAIDLVLVWCLLPPAGRDAFLGVYGAVPAERLLRARVLAIFLCGTLAVYARVEGLPDLEREAVAGLERAAAA